jgi:transketolase C-terminal domain/subunit
LPWLNRIDEEWLEQEFKQFEFILTIDDHYTKLGQGTLISSYFAQKSITTNIFSTGIDEIPMCGQIDEVLKFHRLDYLSVTELIKNKLK